MQYPGLGYVSESEDPTLTIETERLVVKVIDNTGLLAPAGDARPFRGLGDRITDISHHLGYHGIRTIYDKSERRNLVVPFVSWLNLQTAVLEGIAPDPIDERSFAGMARGWPVSMEPVAGGAAIQLDPLPSLQMEYQIWFGPGGPDAVDFSVRFRFGRRPDEGPARFRATWPCYVNGLEDVRFHFPRRWPAAPDAGQTDHQWAWESIGQEPNIVLGETVGYEHIQRTFHAEDQAKPVGFGRIGDRVLAIMFSSPQVRFFVVDAGGHLPFSPIQNPAWDFEWIIDDYPLDTPVGFDGRLVYMPDCGPQGVIGRYEQWLSERRVDAADGRTRA